MIVEMSSGHNGRPKPSLLPSDAGLPLCPGGPVRVGKSTLPRLYKSPGLEPTRPIKPHNRPITTVTHYQRTSLHPLPLSFYNFFNV